jgi:uncharacterized membrane protein HdeD (DUF308 family)
MMNGDIDDVEMAGRDRSAEEAGRLKGLTQAEGVVMILLGVLALSFP